MELKDTYQTIGNAAQGLFKDKGSKFISYAFPVTSENEIKEHVQNLKKEHHNARHHCYAYRLGSSGARFRTNDDGEPSGTAGRPIYGQLLSKELTNILIVVVRYFGGTLLGVSGLINAYKNATIDVINNTEIIEKIIDVKYQLIFDYPLQNSITRILKEYQLKVFNAKYEMDCTLEIALRLTIEKAVIDKLVRIEGLKIKKTDNYVYKA